MKLNVIGVESVYVHANFRITRNTSLQAIFCRKNLARQTYHSCPLYKGYSIWNPQGGAHTNDLTSSWVCFCLLEIFQSLHQYIKHMFYIDKDFEISHTINWLWAGMIGQSVQILEPNPQWCPKVWVLGKSIQIQVKPDKSVTLNAKHVICKIHSEPLTLDILINSGRVYVWFNSLYKINKIITCA